uniref:Protein kinase domain-containing protein n=1 Tax=viral metagenome TaxID=1070528 RepID=A0A6C0C5Z0_9ZZZZ
MGICCYSQTLETETTCQMSDAHEENRYVNKVYVSEGGHGTLYKAYDKETKTLVSCKETPPAKRKNAERESNILKRFNSPVLPQFIDIAFGNDINCLYYKFIPGTDLFTHLFENDRTIAYNDVKILINKMLYSLTELEKYNLVHLDIKFENFIFTKSNNVLTLIDFEGAHDYHDNEFKALETYVGTKSYTAPETWSGVYHKQSDIWSVGVCLWCMLTGQYPFDVDTLDKNDKDTLQFIEKLFIFPQKIHLEKMNDLNFDENLKDLLHRVFTFDAKSRIDITNFKNHTWLKI